jgi:SAM-dependent methyltransferase
MMDMPEGVRFDAQVVAKDCPNCCTPELVTFYTVDQIPVHSCILMKSPDRARDYPRGDLQLGFCRRCGFVCNVRYDVSLEEYSPDYEETQGFSDTFNAFARSLAQRMISRYDIRRKTVLEIGCGKGDFLAMMCRLGDNKGIGIDPAYVPERNPDKSLAGVEFIQDYYDEKYAHLQADVICCRHTLEHIAPTWQFMQTLRNTIGARNDTLIIFELPDVMRVLREGAFWDVYYEHCTYFTTGSLARLFRMTGFAIDELYLDYDNQYIIITAYPTESHNGTKLPLENDFIELKRAYEAFPETCSRKIHSWRNIISDIRRRDKKIVVWGSGSKGVSFLTTLQVGDAVEFVVDINPYKQGRFMPGTGQEIVLPGFLEVYRPDYAIVMNPIYCNEIQKDIDQMKLETQLLPV